MRPGKAAVKALKLIIIIIIFAAWAAIVSTILVKFDFIGRIPNWMAIVILTLLLLLLCIPIWFLVYLFRKKLTSDIDVELIREDTPLKQYIAAMLRCSKNILYLAVLVPIVLIAGFLIDYFRIISPVCQGIIIGATALVFFFLALFIFFLSRKDPS